MTAGEETALANFIRETIRERGPVTFLWFMEQALYHPAYGYYSSGRCVIGRRGDYFTNVSVSSLFGRLMTQQFFEIWERLGRPEIFTIVEQGADDGTFASDVLQAAHAKMPQFFAALRYRIVEPFPILRSRQEAKLPVYRAKLEWRESLEELESFTGVHFSNELLDAMPVHRVSAVNGEWREKYIDVGPEGFCFVDGPLSNEQLRAHLEKVEVPDGRYETEVTLAALDWIKRLSAKLERGVVLTVDYGFARDEFYSAERTAGTLRTVAQHRIVPSPLVEIGQADITAHVDWTSLCECAEGCGLSFLGFTDQHHFVTALATTFLPNELGEPVRRALQTLLHPGLLGRTFQFLALAKNIPTATQFRGFKFARDGRAALGLSRR